MKKSQVTQFPIGSAKYVIMHAKWQISRGRQSSESFLGVTNPREALVFAQKFTRPPKFVKYNIGGKEIMLDVNKIYLDFYRVGGEDKIEDLNFEALLKAVQSEKIPVDEGLKTQMVYLQRWVIDAQRKRSLRKLRRLGVCVMTTDELFEGVGGEEIIDRLENTGFFADYFIKEIFGEEEPVEQTADGAELTIGLEA